MAPSYTASTASRRQTVWPRFPAATTRSNPPGCDAGLGAALPGDLGPPVVRQERDLGVAPAAAQPSAEDQAAEAEKMRLAQQARQAAEAGVFFQLSKQDASPSPAATPPAPAQGAPAGPPTATNPRLSLDPVRDQNDQQRKLDFINEKQDDRAIYNPHGVQTPVSPYEVLAGTIIPASLITGVNSDLPGLVTAQVTENIFILSRAVPC